MTAPILDCGKCPCGEHGGACAFHGDEPDRCPWCHSTWTRILSSGSHSCESAKVWANGKRPDNAEYVAERIAQAAALRQRAAEQASQRPFKGWLSGHCAHGNADTPQPVAPPAKPHSASEEVGR